jgi:streptomycin 6-kinase
VRLPPALVATWRDEGAWLEVLPALASACAETWGLALEEPVDTPRALVVPAGDAVLKLNAPSHSDADHEADALDTWDGHGAVRLLARDDARRALVVERCRPGTILATLHPEAPTLVAGLLARLPRTAGAAAPFRLLADEADRWRTVVPCRWEAAGRPFEQALLDRAVAVFASVDRSARALVNQDLHGWNVLAARREPWLVIDPKPLLGELELDGVGLLRNAAFAGGTTEVRRWLDALVGLGLDRDRLCGWGLAHALAWGTDDEGRWSEASVDAARAIALA